MRRPDTAPALCGQAEAEAERRRLAAIEEEREAQAHAKSLRKAAAEGNWKKVSSLLSWRSPQEGIKVDFESIEGGEHVEPPVMVAARRCHVEAVCELVAAGAAPPVPDGLQRWEGEKDTVMDRAQRLADANAMLREYTEAVETASVDLDEGGVELEKATTDRAALIAEFDADEDVEGETTRQRRSRRAALEQKIEEYDIPTDGIIDRLERKVANAKKVLRASEMPLATTSKRVDRLRVDWQLAFPKDKPPSPRALSPDKKEQLDKAYNSLAEATDKNKRKWRKVRAGPVTADAGLAPAAGA